MALVSRGGATVVGSQIAGPRVRGEATGNWRIGPRRGRCNGTARARVGSPSGGVMWAGAVTVTGSGRSTTVERLTLVSRGHRDSDRQSRYRRTRRLNRATPSGDRGQAVVISPGRAQRSTPDQPLSGGGGWSNRNGRGGGSERNSRARTVKRATWRKPHRIRHGSDQAMGGPATRCGPGRRGRRSGANRASGTRRRAGRPLTGKNRSNVPRGRTAKPVEAGKDRAEPRR